MLLTPGSPKKKRHRKRQTKRQTRNKATCETGRKSERNKKVGIRIRNKENYNLRGKSVDKIRKN